MRLLVLLSAVLSFSALPYDSASTGGWLHWGSAAYAQDVAPADDAAPADGASADDAAPADGEEAASPDAPEEVTPEAPPPNPEDTTAFVTAIHAAATTKSWPVLIGLVLMGAVYVLRKFDIEAKLGVSSKDIPWLALAIAFLSNVGIGMASSIPVSEALLNSLLTAAIAMAGWDLAAVFRSDD